MLRTDSLSAGGGGAGEQPTDFQSPKGHLFPFTDPKRKEREAQKWRGGVGGEKKQRRPESGGHPHAGFGAREGSTSSPKGLL